MGKNLELQTPVLYLIFNRLDTVKQTFPEIQKAQPKQLFIAADGPRDKKEKKQTDAVRKYVLENINWDCKVKTLFRKKNLGCKYAVSGAIDWFFDNVEEGIILEDDCLPDQSFFRFCQEMLERYKDTDEVMMISGDNFIESKTKNLKESYYFSALAPIWGWASWKNSWRKYNLVPSDKEIKETIKNSSLNFLEKKLILKRLKDTKENRIKTWDYQWQFSMIKNLGVSIIPKVNLVENVGLLRTDFTNSKPNKIDFRYLHFEKKNLNFPLIYQKKVLIDSKINKQYIKKDLIRIILKKLF